MLINEEFKHKQLFICQEIWCAKYLKNTIYSRNRRILHCLEDCCIFKSQIELSEAKLANILEKQSKE